MKINKVFFLFLSIAMVGCNYKKESQVITLYKISVSDGNSIINFVSHDDPNGTRALGFCEDMKNLYENKWRERYYCSSVQFDEFIPEVKWGKAQ